MRQQQLSDSDPNESHERNNVATSYYLFRHAEEELANGHPLKASEKAWGAVAHQLKAIARQRRWRHGGHHHFYQIIDQLVEETGDDEIETSFSVADALHGNFYNNFKSESAVRSNIQIVKLLLDKLSAIYENGGRAPNGQTPTETTT